MSDVIHEINGTVSNGPQNWQDIEMVFERTNNSVSLSINNLIFVGTDAKLIKDRLLNGINGGSGVFEGIPHKIKINDSDGNSYLAFDGYLDGTGETNFIGCEETVVDLKKKFGSEWLTDTADGFSFASLYDDGIITNNDFVNVGYVRNYVPDGAIILTLGVSTFVMTKEAIELTREIANQVSELINSVTPNAGAGVTMDIGDIIWAALNIVARIVYGIFIVIAIVKMMSQILEQIFPLKRYHKGMKVLDLFRRACQKLGLSFVSETFDIPHYNSIVYLPKKAEKGYLGLTNNYSGVTGLGGAGYPSNDDPVYTFGNLIRVFKETWNADFKISNGQFRFERRDWWQNNSTYVIPDIYQNQDRRLDEYGLNANEIISNYNINWRYDIQDQNTLDNQKGRVFQATFSPAIVNDPDLVLMKGLKEVQIPFSHAKRKNELTVYEKIGKTLASSVDVLTGLFGNGSNFGAQIQGRIGNMLLSSDMVTVPKLIHMSGTKLTYNQQDLMSAEKLWTDLHFINSFFPVNGVHNQWINMKAIKTPMCLENFLSLVENSNCKTNDGRDARIDRLEFKGYWSEAEMDISINQKYTDNFKITKIT